MAAAAYVDHFAAECLVSMSSRAVVHGPREGPEPGPEACLPWRRRRSDRAPQPGVERARARGGAGGRAGAGARGEQRARPQTKGPAGPKSRRPGVPAEKAQVPLRWLRESLREILAPQGAPENSHRSVGRPERADPGQREPPGHAPGAAGQAQGAVRLGTAGTLPLTPRLGPAIGPARRVRRVRALGAGARPATAPPPGTPPLPARSGGAAGADVVIWAGGGDPAQTGGRRAGAGELGGGGGAAQGDGWPAPPGAAG
uniref:Uncharacterized protein n=1 Tax=Equus asinus asinus TaxID=83772 RepID=A0A8C4MEW9_EQUAS